VTYDATEQLGGKTIRRWTYEAECPWCRGAEQYTDQRKGDK
jgi:hypothetical protein